MRAILCALAIAALSQTAALAAPTLNAVLTCPKTGPNRACLGATLFDERIRGAENNFFPRIAIRNDGPQHLHVWGRLNGGAQTEYDLMIDWEDLYLSGRNLNPAMSYLGRSSDNNPIILTDRGPLEITTAGIDIGTSNYHLVDARRWKRLDPLMSINRGEYIFTAGTRIGVWDDNRKLCITAPVKKPGLLRVAPKHCAARPAPVEPVPPKPANVLKEGIDAAVDALIGIDRTKSAVTEDEQEEIWAQGQAASGAEMGNLVPELTTLRHVERILPNVANEEMGEIDRVWSRWGGMGVGIDVYRIKGSNVLVIVYSADDC